MTRETTILNALASPRIRCSILPEKAVKYFQEAIDFLNSSLSPLLTPKLQHRLYESYSSFQSRKITNPTYRQGQTGHRENGGEEDRMFTV